MLVGYLGGIQGLSPRLRGNRQLARLAVRGHGSIPALTGKPRFVPTDATVRKVYPRAYGETR